MISAATIDGHDRRQPAVDERAHDVLAPRVRSTSGTSANGIPKLSTTCEMTSERDGFRPMASTISAGRHRDQPAQDERDRARDEALHDDLPGVGAHARGGQARGQQRQREGQRGPAAGQRGELRVRLLDRVEAEQAAVVEQRRRR